LKIHVGHPEHEFIAIDVISRTHPDANDFYDGNWLNTKVLIEAGSFSGTINGQLRAEELVSFQDELTKLHESLSGSVKFSTMEEWLSFEMTGDGKGHFSCTGKIADEVGYGNVLNFQIYLDQTFIPEILNGLGRVVKAFPVLGTAQKAG